MSRYTPKTAETAEAYDYGFRLGVEETLGELHEVFGSDLEQTDIWKEYIEKGVTDEDN